MDQIKDIKGRVYAQLSKLKPGDAVVVDAGFDCLKPWHVATVRADSHGELYIPCKAGMHMLIGQAVDGENLIGIYPEGTPK